MGASLPMAMRPLGVLLVLTVLGACGFGAAPLPKATAVIGSTTISLPRGSYCWSSGGQSTCADSAPVEDLLRTGYLKPITAVGATPVTVSFDRASQKFDVNIALATPPATVGPVEQSGGTFLLPSAPGLCVFVINGAWPEGNVDYFLPVDVLPEGLPG